MMITEKIEKILEEEVNPVLAQHYGGAQLTEYAEGTAWIKMTGTCGSCPSAKDTIEDVIKAALMRKIPDIKDVQLDNSVSEDLLDFAKQLLRK